METFKIVIFKLGEEEYGLNIDYVQSIERILPITRVPNTHEYVKGVINLRGNVTPVIELGKRLNQGETHYSDNTRIIISKYEDIELGLIVDQTSDVMDISNEDLEEASATGIDFDALGGIVNKDGRLIILIKLEELMKTALV